MIPRLTLIAICLCLTQLGSLRAQPQENLEQLFENSIRPVLTSTCFSCHGDPGAKLSGGLRVDSRQALLNGGDSGPAIDIERPEQSLLLKAIARADGVSPMPPNNDRALRADQVAVFEKWIAAGAPWPEKTAKFESHQHWAFKPLTFGERDIDYWIRASQRDADAAAAPRADKRTLVRRATFDLTGLPPTYEQVVEFERDESPAAYAKLIDRLLESPAYGERWGRHWLDVVRYADTAGETADYPVPNAWRYRNYVIEAFQQDKPFDQFLREQIAGDILAEEDTTTTGYASKVVATGYLAISRRFGFDSENYQHLTIQDTIDTVGQSVLGLSLGCARCHDHKFDPISMQDYYALYGIFDSTRYAFPGSEQKQKIRSMMPLVPAREASATWRKFDQRVSSTRQKLERNGQPVTPAVLRMLNDIDGDFELQAPAAGGSNGVLVPPWLSTGAVIVSNAAQSPFRHVYGPGKSGIHVEPGDEAAGYRVTQSLSPRRTATRDPRLQFHLDFRLADSSVTSTGKHQIWLGSYPNSPAMILEIAPKSTAPKSTDSLRRTVRRLSEMGHYSIEIEPGKWNHVQIDIDLVNRKCTVRAGEPGNSEPGNSEPGLAPFGSGDAEPVDIPLHDQWNGALDLVMLRSSTEPASGARPAIDFDNLAIGEPSAFDEVTSNNGLANNGLANNGLANNGLANNGLANNPDEDASSINKRLTELIGPDGDFELQALDQAPAAPWNAGPNSVVKILERAQSPSQSMFPPGTRGVHMPNRGQYDGFGCGLPTAWNANTQETLSANFEFRCADASAGGNGSWRFYVGHGPGNSAAVELFFNDQQLFTRNGDARSPVGSLKVGQWYRVELELNLKNRQFVGSLHALDGEAHHFQWESIFASGWDGMIDHTFIDSYGHIGGVRPALDVDNYSVGLPQSAPTNKPGQTNESDSAKAASISDKRQQVSALRQQLSGLKESLKTDAAALERDLASGPFELAYAVAEGTPHDAYTQLRGEPSQPGELAPRGFIKVLGGQSLPSDAPGSGRLQLANWLTRDMAHLTARVMVNRLWHFHFGRGLVATPNDFGVRGQPPTHPELLDQLASDFIRSGWSIKAMHRQIMLSETYQQASVWPESARAGSLSRDLLVGFARRRLSAEEIRDSILSVSGLLDNTPGTAHPFTPPTSWGYTQHAPFSAVYDHDKRSVYLMTQRLKRHPFLALFDGSDPNASTAVRLGTTVPTQALYFMNDPFVHRASNQWASSLRQVPTDDERIVRAFASAYQRQPTQSELEETLKFLATYRSAMAEAGMRDEPTGSHAFSAVLRTLIGSNEFLHVD